VSSLGSAIACAKNFMNAYSSSHDFTYTIQIGTASAMSHLTVDLTIDPVSGARLTDSAIQLMNINPSPFDSSMGTGQCGSTSCIVIEGYGGSNSGTNTTLVTPSGYDAFKGTNVSHLVIRHLTMRQQADAMVQGTVVCPSGSPCQGSVSLTATVSGSMVTGTFPTLKVSLNQPTNVIEDPIAFASIANPGSVNACGSGASTCSVSETLALATGCTTPAVIGVTVAEVGSTWEVTQIGTIITPAGGCTDYPISSTPVAGYETGLTVPVNPTFYVAYRPSPLSAWNVRQNTQDPQRGASIRAYTNVSAPTKVITATSGSASGVDPREGWGDPSFTSGATSVFLPVPPTFVPGMVSGSGTWTLTMNTPLSGTTPDPAIEYIYAATTAGVFNNIVCVHADSGEAAFFNDLNAGALGGYDITFDDMTWINAGRVTFRGIFGASVIRSTIERDPAFPGGQAPCFSAGAGGLQFGKTGDPATADDSIAMFDENGTHPFSNYPTSSIMTTMITDADNRSINLDNDEAITHLTLTTTGSNTLCSIPNSVMVDQYSSAQPVNISSFVEAYITNYGSCDPCQIYCPVTVTKTN
jgi:hypothetical protein